MIGLCALRTAPYDFSVLYNTAARNEGGIETASAIHGELDFSKEEILFPGVIVVLVDCDLLLVSNHLSPCDRSQK